MKLRLRLVSTLLLVILIWNLAGVVYYYTDHLEGWHYAFVTGVWFAVCWKIGGNWERFLLWVILKMERVTRKT